MRNASPEKKTLTVNGVTTQYWLSGACGPVVVLLNGFRMPLVSWDRLYPELEKHARIFAYNRHRVGKTSKTTCPLCDSSSCQSELAALSPHAAQIIANNSGHFPQITEPEIVIRTIQERVAQVC